jgi:hypothetical protein
MGSNPILAAGPRRVQWRRRTRATTSTNTGLHAFVFIDGVDPAATSPTWSRRWAAPTPRPRVPQRAGAVRVGAGRDVLDRLKTPAHARPTVLAPLGKLSDEA